MADRINLFGPFEVVAASGPVKLGGTKPRAVVAMLALDAGRVVSTDRLIDGLWGDDPPDTATASLQVHVSAARKALASAGAGVAIETKSPGYRLAAPDAEIDLAAVEAALRSADAAATGGDVEAAEVELAQALAGLGGVALSDLAGEPFGEAAVVRLDELRRQARFTHAALRLDLGRHGETVAELEALVSEYPLHESVWALLMTALYRSGRQADGLAAFQRCRDHLLDELGIDPGSELRDLEAAILRQDASLDLVASDRVTSAEWTLTIRRGVAGKGRLVGADGTEVALDHKTLLGRHSDCNLRVDDGGVSRRHCEINADLLGYVLVDLGSTNGTFLNGELISRQRLADGDVLTLGDSDFTFRMEPA